MNTRIQKERTHVFAPSISVAVAATIAGKIDEEQLSAAITKAVLNNEILNCKIELNENGEAFYTKTDAAPFMISCFATDWKTVVEQQECIPFDLEKGELIRFFTRIKPDGAQLIMIAHHLAGDGLSLAYLLEDIIKALNGRPLEDKPLTLFDYGSLPPDSRLNPLMRLMLNFINKKWRKTGKQFAFSEYKTMFQNYWNHHKTDIYDEEIGENQLSVLKDAANKHGITLNSLLTAAFIKTAGEQVGTGLAASIRPKDYRGMGNYATGISIHYAYDTAKDFWANAQTVHRLIYKKLNTNRDKYFLLQFMNAISPTLIDAVYFSAFGSYENKTAKTVSNLFGYGGTPKNISITNLTTLDIDRSDEAIYLADVLFVPPLVPNARYIIGISTLRNKMSLSLHVEQNEHMNQELTRFSDAITFLKQLT